MKNVDSDFAPWWRGQRMVDDPRRRQERELIDTLLRWHDTYLLCEAARLVIRQGPGGQLEDTERRHWSALLDAIEDYHRASGTRPLVVERLDDMVRGRQS